MPIEKNITPSCPSNYGTGGDGHPCTVNVTAWTDPGDLDLKSVRAIHINELRAAIRDEQARRGIALTDFGPSLTSADKVTAAHCVAIRNAINTLKSFTWTYGEPTASSSIIIDEYIEEYRAKVNDAEDDCLCHCNYCTCNCNYCTCDCNYCTCDCNYCTCNCNYPCTCNCNYSCTCNCNYSCTCNCAYRCTCNCNYSDRRLKKNIIYI